VNKQHEDYKNEVQDAEQPHENKQPSSLASTEKSEREIKTSKETGFCLAMGVMFFFQYYMVISKLQIHKTRISKLW